MEITKHEFGRFVTERRRHAGLTQRQLAARLHVTESAVSKWERGLSYPDITLVAALATELDVSANELISATEDRVGRRDVRDAQVYRRWRGAVLWSTLSMYVLGILACGIVNLSVDHTLDWFWTVLPAVALAFCLTTLPLLRVPRPGWTALVGAVISLVSLLIVVWVSYAPGSWLAVTCAAVLFGLLVVFGPIWLWLLDLPAGCARHRTVLALAFDTVALFALLLVIFLSVDRLDLFRFPTLQIAAIGLVPVWITALAIRYLPFNGLGRAAVVVAFLGACGYVIGDVINELLREPSRSGTLDLTVWSEETINSNVGFLILVGSLLVAAVLGVASLVRARARKRHADAPTDEAIEPGRVAGVV